MLNGGPVTYPIEFHPEADKELNSLLYRLYQSSTENGDSTKTLSLSLLREIGTRLWHILMPSTVSMKNRIALADELRKGFTPLSIEIPTSLTMLPWELLCAPYQREDTVFLAHRRPIVRITSGGIILPPLSPPLPHIPQFD